MFRGLRVTLIIPALNEAETIAGLLGRVDRTLVDDIIVADNGSRDGTAAQAVAAGAIVRTEPRRGYGRACLKALREASQSDLLVFMDADGSDDPAEIGQLLVALLDQGADLVIGSRVLGRAEAGALSPLQRFGNALTCRLVHWLWGVSFTDLGPFRAIRSGPLAELQMSDPDFGWTIEMQVKAVQRGLKVVEVPVRYRRRQGGKSKVSGTVLGSLRAGKRILGYVLAAKTQELWAGRQSGFRGGLADDHRPEPTLAKLIVFTRFPEAGRAKTRLMGNLGPEGSATLHRRLAEHAIEEARRFAAEAEATVEIHFCGGTAERMRRWIGPDLICQPQAGIDLGARMNRAFCEAFAGGAASAVIMGTDCPDLRATTLARAFDALGKADLVLGPATDGGYYLIGLRRPVPELLREMPWSTERVLIETRARAAEMGLVVELLPELADVDWPADLDRVPEFLAEDS